MVDSDDGARDDGARDDGARERDEDVDADARALASVIRWRILRLCLDEALTNREIAARLHRDPGTVYHHVRTLAERGFLAPQAERRGNRGAREIPYLATGKTWRTEAGPMLNGLLVETFLEELGEADPASVSLGRLGLRLDEAGRAELGRRIGELLQEFADRGPTADGVPYSLFIAIHEDTARR